MAAPKKKTSKGRRNRRRSHSAPVAINSTMCKKCGALKMPHTKCAKCNDY